MVKPVAAVVFLIISLGFGASLTAAPAAAPPAAAPPAAAPPAAAPPAKPAEPAGGERNRGIMVSLGYGGTGCTGSYCSEHPKKGPFMFGRLGVLYRVVKYFALGLHVSANFFDPDANSLDMDTALYWQLHLAAEVRGIIPWRKLDFWGGLTFGYIRDFSYVEYHGESAGEWMHGYGIGWGAGAQYYFVPAFAAGVDVWFHKGIFTRSCYDDPLGGDQVCTDLDEENRDAMGYGVTWAVGLTLTYYYGM